ncbi:DUF1573 domain-containing protein [Bacteroides thetaiotaomicron]|uniref:DUF1573 domain-containing protein n=1 Tax=Bacteroides thetaiotaomicron TaxID=818 RepID=UPI0039C4B478
MRYFIILIFVIILCGCDNSQMASSSSTPLKSNMNEEEPVFSFSNEVIDLGTIDKKKNEFVTTSFQFANMGTKPLVIKKVDVSCGCVKVDYDKSPIVKGQKSEIKVTLDVRKLNGYFHKKIYIISNVEDDIEELLIKGTIIENL